MNRAVILDHDYVVDKYLNVYQVVGGSINEWIIPVIHKYRVSREKVFLGGRGFGLARLFEKYTPRVASISKKKIFLSFIKASQPFITPIEIKEYFSPRIAVSRLIRRAGDALEKKAVELISMLIDAGISMSELGVTGSLMMGIHNPSISDIDLVVYDCRLVDEIKQARILTPFSNGLRRKWAEQQSKRLGIPISIAERLYNPCRRALFKGTQVSVIPVFRRPGWLSVPDLSRATYLGDLEAIVKLDINDCNYMYYPHVFRGEVIASNRKISDKRNATIVSYESLYSFISADTKLAKARGVSYLLDNTVVIVIGGRETTSYIYPLGSSSGSRITSS
jgi:predicted nucleotidyltransferase